MKNIQLSPFQPLAGQRFWVQNRSVLCLAACQNAILTLYHNAEGVPMQYIVCHQPEARDGQLSWAAGEYFPFAAYSCEDPASAALSDAVDALLHPSLLAFLFPQHGDSAAQSLAVKVFPQPDDNTLAEIEDSICAYLENVEDWTPEQLLCDVMDSFPRLSFRLLRPEKVYLV